jgi:hypothetical protein
LNDLRAAAFGSIASGMAIMARLRRQKSSEEQILSRRSSKCSFGVDEPARKSLTLVRVGPVMI